MDLTGAAALDIGCLDQTTQLRNERVEMTSFSSQVPCQRFVIQQGGRERDDAPAQLSKPSTSLIFFAFEASEQHYLLDFPSSLVTHFEANHL